MANKIKVATPSVSTMTTPPPQLAIAAEMEQLYLELTRLSY